MCIFKLDKRVGGGGYKAGRGLFSWDITKELSVFNFDRYWKYDNFWQKWIILACVYKSGGKM